MTITDIAQQNDTLETLKALRDKLSETLDGTTSGRDVAQLSRQLQACLMQISEIEEKQIDDTDEISQIINSIDVRTVHSEQRNQNFTLEDSED